MLGEGKAKDQLKKAKTKGMDLLLVFTISVSGEAIIKNLTKMTVYDVASGEKVHISRTINNVQVQKLGDEAKQKEFLHKEFDRLFKKVDDDEVKPYKLADLPKGLTKERVQPRLVSLVEQKKYTDPLRMLVEIRFYNWNQLIDKEATAALYKSILGSKRGKSLATGAAKARRSALDLYLPKTAAGSSLGDGDGGDTFR